MKITPLAAGVAAIALAAVAGGAPAEAAAPFVTRDGGYALAANCPSVPDGTQCDATPYPVVFGPGTTGVTADTGIITSLFAHAEVNTSYGSAFGTASHDGALGLPVLRALADSSLAAGGRYSTTYGQATSVTALTYTGSTDTALPLLGTVNGQISGYGYGEIRAQIAILSPDYFDVTIAGSTSCGDAGVIASASTVFSSGGGSTVSAATDCGGAAFIVKPGEQFYVFESLSAYAYRTTLTDAAHTFTLGLDPAYGDTAAQTALLGDLVTSTAPAPEPATWALMMLGVGGMGAALRTRRRAARATV